MQILTGTQLKAGIISGANHLANHRQEVDLLNIFPVPDGDTGTNMSMTAQAAVKALHALNTDDINEVAKTTASALLRGAKGNSGVILSILWKGFAKGISDVPEVNGNTIVTALGLGVEMAYGAVMNPTEGTILTVARMAQEAGQKALEENTGVLHVWNAVCKGARHALEMTPEILHVLKRANVVDAGGMGLCLVFEGMLSVLAENTTIQLAEQSENAAQSAPTTNHIGDEAFRLAAAEYDNDSTFTYCTEFIISRKPNVVPEKLRSYLMTIGDCVVVVDDDDIIKVHVHTDNPGKALQEGLKFGPLLTVKVDNMREQAKELVAEEPFTAAEPTEEFGFVSVAAGDGLEVLFRDLGCAQVVNGGQSMNPSTEDIVKAILSTPAKTVYVLPNNKNIIMAAEQAISLVEDREVVLIPTKTVPQGISALIAFSGASSAELNKAAMMEAAQHVATGQVTYAARNSRFGSTKIRTGDMLGLVNGKLKLVEKEQDPTHTVINLIRSMTTKDTNFITIIYGEDVTEEQAATVYERIRAKTDRHIEINLIHGGQPIYYYLVSVE